MRNPSHRFWLCIAAAVAVSVIAVPAASAGVHKYDTKVTIGHEAPGPHTLWHGYVKSKVRKCERGRQVTLFKQRPGADRKLGTVRSRYSGGSHAAWGLVAPAVHRAYAKVTREEHNRFVCRADRSPTITLLTNSHPRA